MTQPVWAERLLAFSKRELKIRASYRMTLVITLVTGISGILTYGFLGNSATGSLTSSAYRMSLGSYLVSGIAFSPIITNGFAAFSQFSNPGELEDIMTTPIGFGEYVLEASSFSFLTTLGGAALFFGASIFILGLDYSIDPTLLSVTLLLGIVLSIAIGFIGLGLRLVYKQTSLLSWALFSLAGLVGNMIVPVQALPSLAQYIAYLTPQFYFFTSIRMALGATSSPSNPILIGLAAYTAILFAIGVYALNRGLRFVRRNGTHRWC